MFPLRPLIAAALLAATPALADDTKTSALIASDGLTGARKALQAQPPGPDRDLGLAAVTFLAGIEAGYQARWRVGATNPMLPVPVIGTPLPENGSPEPMTGDMLSQLLSDLAAAMAATREALPTDPDPDAALVLRLDDVWLDVNGDGQRLQGAEGLLRLAGLPMPEPGRDVIRFDAADAHWLRAYTHLIEGTARAALAFDPETALSRMIALRTEVARQQAEGAHQLAREPMMRQQAAFIGPFLDIAAVTLQTLRNQPDPEGIQAAADHLTLTVDANRDFWAAVATETDNDREWIPNDSQQAALGFQLPPGTGDAWLDVLDEGRMVLSGERLIPHWRMEPGYGIDLSKWIAEPTPVDFLGWAQGADALAFTGPGLTIGRDAWRRFGDMFGGRAGLYMVLFN
ncbi:hypothetical protein [Paracoccus tegillarcae]|nr:hypothetical protein [Paracoccus tegillarcae]